MSAKAASIRTLADWHCPICASRLDGTSERPIAWRTGLVRPLSPLRWRSPCFDEPASTTLPADVSVLTGCRPHGEVAALACCDGRRLIQLRRLEPAADARRFVRPPGSLRRPSHSHCECAPVPGNGHGAGRPGGRASRPRRSGLWNATLVEMFSGTECNYRPTERHRYILTHPLRHCASTFHVLLPAVRCLFFAFFGRAT